MITLLIGVPGSGKTYFAVNELVKYAKNATYKNIYTNINGLKIDDLNKLNDKVKFHRFDYDLFYDEVEKEYKFFLDNPKIEDYDKQVKKEGILKDYYDSLIIIDEAQMYLLPTDPNKRFVTYHRHYKIDMLYITQAKHLLDKIFLINIEKLIVAVPPAKRFLNSGFRYFFYPSSKEFRKDLYAKETLFLKNKISYYYDSGSNKLSKSVFLKFFTPIIGLFLIAYLPYYYYTSKHEIKPDNNITVSRDSNINKVSNISVPTSVSTNNIYKIICNENIKTCVVKNNSFVFKISNLVKIFQKCKLDFTQKSFNKSVYVFSCNDPKINSILEVLNDKKIDINNNTNKLF